MKDKRMDKGFTLIELVTVVIIIAILAALAIPQYAQVMERSRGAEAKESLGHIRTLAIAAFQQGQTVTPATAIQSANIPTACQSTHFFSYGITGSGNNYTIVATRCASGGKPPQGIATNNITLLTGVDGMINDNWTISGPY